MPIDLTPEQRDRIVNWFLSHLPNGVDAACAAADAGSELNRANQALRDVGIDYPLGAHGAQGLAMLFKGAIESRDEAVAEAAKHKLKPEDEGNGPMTAHELAHVQLTKPDLPVTIQRRDKGIEFVTSSEKEVVLLDGESVLESVFEKGNGPGTSLTPLPSGPVSMAVMTRKPTYPSELTDEQWALIEPLLPPANTGGRPEKHPAVMWWIRSCTWCVPAVPGGTHRWASHPGKGVYWYFSRREAAKVTEQITAALRHRLRKAQGGGGASPWRGSSIPRASRVPTPSAHPGFMVWAKRSTATRGSSPPTPWGCCWWCVMAASVQDRDGARTILLSLYLYTPVRGSREGWSPGPRGSWPPRCTSCARLPARWGLR